MKIVSLLMFLFLQSCSSENEEHKQKEKPDKKEVSESSELQNAPQSGVQLVVLGTVQDAGSPQIGCYKACCEELQKNPDSRRKIVSLGVIDHNHQKKFLFEATPDFISQWHALNQFAGFDTNQVDGVFITHAHIGHYTGLMFLGMESMNGDHVPVYSMPKMSSFLNDHGPWSQLVEFGNIDLKPMANNVDIELTNDLRVEAILVPHRDEFSETVGFRITGPNKSALFIPDINKWSVWETSIVDEIKKVDYAFLDGSFYDGNELPNRDMDDIPHPFIVESMNLFKELPEVEKSKIHFIHFNHTNPLLLKDSEQYQTVVKEGYKIAGYHQFLEL